MQWTEYGVENASDWRVFKLGLLLKEVGMGILCKVDPGCVTRLKTFVGKVAHLCRVYKMYHDTHYSEKELRSLQERDSTEVLHLVKVVKQSFSS